MGVEMANFVLVTQSNVTMNEGIMMLKEDFRISKVFMDYEFILFCTLIDLRPLLSIYVNILSQYNGSKGVLTDCGNCGPLIIFWRKLR